MLVFGHISWQNYIGESHWLLWLLGPATIAFAVPVYDNLAIIKQTLIYSTSVSGWAEAENASGAANNEAISVVTFNIEISSRGLF
ncbi:LrgB family protein, partial [Salmonella enterica subsp. enterica serovar Anatum]|nr:LrgB family protein [Salmonella enterica subsp. enterica serovar Anatum]